jgi:hypothetical protein
MLRASPLAHRNVGTAAPDTPRGTAAQRLGHRTGTVTSVRGHRNVGAAQPAP